MSVDERLRALEVAWPEEPDATRAVRARLERPRRRWPRVAIPLAVLVLVAAVPPARSTVLDWLGLGGETIQRVPAAPTSLGLGTRVPLPPRALIPGAPHALLYQDPTGTILPLPARLAGHTLVWQHGDRTLRLEADIPRSRALAIARSVPREGSP